MARRGRGIMRALTGGNMDEELRVRLARSNINITDINRERVLFEFPYHPRPGEVRWCKSFTPVGDIDELPELVLRLRKELEG